MYRKLKVLIARWLARRIEMRNRRLRRSLRDYQRGELQRIQAADRRAAACGSTPHGLSKRTRRYATEQSCHCCRRPVSGSR